MTFDVLPRENALLHIRMRPQMVRMKALRLEIWRRSCRRDDYPRPFLFIAGKPVFQENAKIVSIYNEYYDIQFTLNTSRQQCMLPG